MSLLSLLTGFCKNTLDARLGFDVEVFFLYLGNVAMALFFFWSLVNRAALCAVFSLLF